MTTIVEVETGAGDAVRRSAVSWAAIFAGSVVAIATTLVLIALGSGLGFAAASPWPGTGPTVTTFAVTAGIWLIVTQWLSSVLGGYIAGRLRTKWAGIRTHEVLFRDTAHGLLAWSVASVIIATVAFAMAGSAVRSASDASAAVVSYAADGMLRPARSNMVVSPASRDELVRALAREGGLPGNDRAYVAKVVSQQTGLTVTESERRVDAAVGSIRAATDKARKVSSALGFFTALSMLIGAFIASAAAAYAGGLRDQHADV